jgi:Tripartite tricarboxylate transporter TctB family
VSLRAHIRDGKDVVAGLLFAAIGLATVVVASAYPLGTMRSIGPGYFPIMIGVLLALLGAGIAFQGMSFSGPADPAAGDRAARAEDDEGIAIRPLIMITLAVVAFGVLVRPLGLAIATIALVALSSLAGPEFGVRRVLLLSAGLIALSWATFIYLLGLPMTLWPR